jgi:hypothetical protein
MRDDTLRVPISAEGGCGGICGSNFYQELLLTVTSKFINQNPRFSERNKFFLHLIGFGLIVTSHS